MLLSLLKGVWALYCFKDVLSIDPTWIACAALSSSLFFDCPKRFIFEHYYFKVSESKPKKKSTPFYFSTSFRTPKKDI